MSRPKKAPSWKLSKETARIAAYWRDSILDAELPEVSARDANLLGTGARTEDPFNGRCSPSAYAELLRKKPEKQHYVKGRPSSQRGGKDLLDVVICPARFTRDDREGFGPRSVDVFWIPAIMDEAGFLHPPTRKQPWIPKSLLEPQTLASAPSIGRIEDVEAFSASPKRMTEWDSWSVYFRYCQLFFSSITERSIEDLSIEEYSRSEGCSVLLDLSSQNTYSALVRTLDEILEGKQAPGLLPKLAAIAKPEAKAYSLSIPIIRSSASAHCGQFGDSFPLARSQRLAVHRFMETREGEILPVTGPPGTGKTTFLQSIVASLWVDAACRGKPPPIIAACGATNQSVTNILDSFAGAESSLGLFAERWLPDVRSYGTFCCSKTKAEESRRYQLELRDGEGFSFEREQPDFLEEGRKYFLQRAGSCFGGGQ